MSQILYKLIYQDNINRMLRNASKPLKGLLPAAFRLAPSGCLDFHLEGKTLKIHTNQTNFGTKLIFWEGLENFEYTKIFLQLIKKIDTFYDIGANIGLYSLLAAHLNPNAKIVSFEPAEGPLHYLKKNVAANNFSNIEISNLALSQSNGVLEFYEIKNKKYKYLQHNLGGEGNAGSKTTQRNFVKTQVQTTTLDEFSEKRAHRIDLIKIDTEGTEHFILGAAHNVLSNDKPIVICETLFNTIEPELEALFKKYNYQFYNHTESGLEKVDTIVRRTDNGVRNCFFVHESKESMIVNYQNSHGQLVT